MSNYKASSDFEKELDERVVEINRVATVVKGGRRFSFRVTVVVGDHSGSAMVDALLDVVDAVRRLDRGHDQRVLQLQATEIPGDVRHRAAPR